MPFVADIEVTELFVVNTYECNGVVVEELDTLPAEA